ncbi:uncharacterized protein N7483_001508 [Penicillium malachiteum]|uniref:uncharacterized protein n=1 Tax=Penicillium malachiteum TaxID=1324776 RepID=UPI002547A3DF|nr:uncharacterized protein N7483_001508 [Penicillium malachiteum]KAJ5736383.1 hypothetical protein N7483_001508 [Penicillium malachiteum]
MEPTADPNVSRRPEELLDDGETAINAQRPIIIDNFDSDPDSEFSTEGSDMTSLSSSVFDYEYENGRRYHSPRAGNYMMPNDEQEQDRMDLAHHIWLLLLGGELYKAPVKNPQKVLDLETGTGIWAMDMADKFPEAHVIGNDLSAIQPSWVTPNVEFIVEDYESEWLYKHNSFDFIHARLLSGCVVDWSKFLRNIYDHLKPGAYFEIQESALWAWSDDGSMEPNSPLLQYLSALEVASHKIGRDLNVYYKLRDWLVGAGFEDVQQFMYFLPYAPWPRDPHLKELGKFQLAMAQIAVESYGLRLQTGVLGWGEQPSKIFNATVTKQMRDKNNHSYCKEVVVYGRKPLR